MRTFTPAAAAIFAVGAALAAELPDYISAQHATVLSRWLRTISTTRVLTDRDRACDDEIAKLRKGDGPAYPSLRNYHPYYAVGDFNFDGIEDFAVVAIDVNQKRLLAIFNGPLAHRSSPSYLSSDSEGALFYFKGRSKREPLLVGPFESEGGSLEPREDGTYTYLENDCC